MSTDQRLRIAFFPCAFHEVDGVANTARHFEAFAERRGFPMLTIHGGDRDYVQQSGSIVRLGFRRRWPKCPLDKNHDFDLFFWRYYGSAKRHVLEFKPDVIHITGPSDAGFIGTLLAHRLRIPLVGSWHTNLHEYARRRALPLLRFLPMHLNSAVGEKIEAESLRLLALFYSIPRLLFAPNQELIDTLQPLTHKPCWRMARGVDVDLFTPERRTRRSGPFTFGYVGRLSVEKNVAFLRDLEQRLAERGYRNFRIVVVGQGSEETWLRENLRHAHFTGVLQGSALAEAYANMDVFVFPSRTDTFGNVVLEALAAGVPAIVTDSGGPKFIVRHGETGFVAATDDEFVTLAANMLDDPKLRAAMSPAARTYALQQSWDVVFDSVFTLYRRMLADTSRSGTVDRSRVKAAGAPSLNSGHSPA